MNNYWLEVVKFVIMVVAFVIAFMVLDKAMTTKVEIESDSMGTTTTTTDGFGNKKVCRTTMFPSGRIVSSCE